MTARQELEAACREQAEAIANKLYSHAIAAHESIVEGRGAVGWDDKAVREWLDARLRLWAERLIADRDFEWWQAVGGVDTVPMTPEGCKAWQIALCELAKQEERERLSVQGAPTPQIPLGEDWPEVRDRLKANIRRSERITGEDLATRIGGAPTPTASPVTALLAAANDALVYFERCVEPPCHVDGEDAETVPEADALRIAIAAFGGAGCDREHCPTCGGSGEAREEPSDRSPDSVPPQLEDFAARGFERRNRKASEEPCLLCNDSGMQEQGLNSWPCPRCGGAQASEEPKR